MPPPDATGEEAAYLARLREKRTPIAVEMLDGEVFHGVIEYYDRDMLKVNRLDGTSHVLTQVCLAARSPHHVVRQRAERVRAEEARTCSVGRSGVDDYLTRVPGFTSSSKVATIGRPSRSAASNMP